MLRNQLIQRRGITDTIFKHRCHQTALLENHIGRHLRVHILQHVVVLRAQIGKWRDQRARTHPRHQVEHRAVATLRPTGEQTCPESAIVATARNRQIATGALDVLHAHALLRFAKVIDHRRNAFGRGNHIAYPW